MDLIGLTLFLISSVVYRLGGEYDGGSNGSDGEGKYAGKGSGLDISLISLEKFVLNPGDGGVDYYHSGGGGGVLVNGLGQRLLYFLCIQSLYTYHPLN